MLHRKRVKGLGTNAEIVWGDTTQPGSVRKALDGVDAVVHLAGLERPLTEQDPELAGRVNVGGTRTIVDAIKERGEYIPFVFTSSTAVFGPCPDATECLHPDRNQCNPTPIYTETKTEAEPYNVNVPMVTLIMAAISMASRKWFADLASTSAARSLFQRGAL